MRTVLTEYLLKGLFLGLLLFVSLQHPVWEKTGEIALYMLIGLGIALGLGLLLQIKDVLYLVRKPHTSLLFLLLENPLLIYAGLIFGLAFGTIRVCDISFENTRFLFCLIGGGILGYGMHELRGLPDWRYRIGTLILVGFGLVYGLDAWLDKEDPSPTLHERQLIGLHLLLGLPFFYLLIFTGQSEESEVDIGILCTFLGLALHLYPFPRSMPAVGETVIPLGVFFSYLFYILPDLRVFKHTLRGYCHLQLSHIRPALLAFRRALQLDPDNALAYQGMEALHLRIDIDKLDAETLGLLDRELCLNRVRALLGRKPNETQRIMAERYLTLVEKQWPKWISHVIYFRAVLAIHKGEIDRACEMLTDLIAPEGWFADDVIRKKILFDAWQLVLLVHPTLKQRVGDVQIQLPGRRMEAIGAVERQMQIAKDDPAVQEFRSLLYESLREEEFREAAKEQIPADFGYSYAEQIGLALIIDRERWRRGCEFLRMAAVGQPLRRPSIYQKLAEAYTRAGETLEATRYLRLVRDSALEVGIAQLPPDQKQVYFTTVRRLAEEARAREDIDEAIYNFSLATHSDDNIKETLRSLAEMYEKKKDVFNALRVNEKALLYDGRDEDLLSRKDRYYYSLEPDVLREIARADDNVRKYFDVEYCIRKAKQTLDTSPADNLDLLDWAEHLIKLALVMEPTRMMALAQLARCQLRRGERMEAVRILEDIRERTPSGNEELDAWYYTQKQLGLLYLDELARPDLAIACFQEYLKHIGSGAESLYNLGRAYEANGNVPEAIRAYNQVTAYEGHPLAWEAQEAIRRLKDRAA